jgi:radical SAM superfamily enzyme YgiQ (UPF0313 family)
MFVDNLLLEYRDGMYQFYKQPHLGLISLAAVAERAGHTVSLYDPKLELQQGKLFLDTSLYRRIAENILAFAPDAVGLTSLGCNFICTAKIASYLKSFHPNLPVLLGGPHATILDRAILQNFTDFDVIVRNEAENTLLPVLDGLRDREFRSIPGVSFRKGDTVISNPGEPLITDLDALPWPAYHLYPLRELNLKSIRVEAGRGCPFSCTFCSTASFFGRKFRLKSAERLCAELDYLYNTFGLADFSLTHDLFTVNRAKVVEFCDRVSGRGYSWACSARMDCVDQELLEIMRASGCRSIYYGIETGSERMQKVVDKRQDLRMVRPTLDISERLDLFSTVSLITGYPQEEQADQEDSLDLVGECFYRDPAKVRVQLHLLTPEPGTRLMQEFGPTLKYDGHITDFNFPTLEADDAAIMADNPEVFMNHHYFPTVLPRERHVFVTTMFSALHELGFPVLRHMLSYYDGRLSRLMNDCYEFLGNVTVGNATDSLIAFTAHRWGSDHYLASIVRYVTTANRLSNAAAWEEQMRQTVGNSVSQEAGSYRLSHRAALLRRIHDCKRILDLIYESPGGHIHIPDGLAGMRKDYCVVLGEDHDRKLRNYELEPGWADLYEKLAEALPYDQLAISIRRVRKTPGRIRPIVEGLLHEGILRQVSPGHSGTSSTWWRSGPEMSC